MPLPLLAAALSYLATFARAAHVQVQVGHDELEEPLQVHWDSSAEDLHAVARASARLALRLAPVWPGCDNVECVASEIAWKLERAANASHADTFSSEDPAHGLRLLSFSLQGNPKGREPTAIAVNVGHDAAISVSVGGRVQCTLELERLFEERYYESKVGNPEKFTNHWRYAINAVRENCECDDGACPRHFDHGIIVNPFLEYDRHFIEHNWLPDLFEDFFFVEQWRRVDHHEAHARLGFFASPFRSALVVSVDGGGNNMRDGTHAYLGRFGELTRLARLDYNLGEIYGLIPFFLPEVTGQSVEEPCKLLEAGRFNGSFEFGRDLSLVGQLMGYAAIGEPWENLTVVLREWFKPAKVGLQNSKQLSVPHEILEAACSGTAGQRALAATAQQVFQEEVRNLVERLLPIAGGRKRLDGVVLTGGCALNVLANQLVEDSIDLPVFVPPNPNDGGLTVGALWSVNPPPTIAPLQYSGFRLWDIDTLADEVVKRSAVRLESPCELADILAGFNPEGRRPIVAIVRGRQEYGPRALGHRSLVAVPDEKDVTERINRLKQRQWYRPAAPMIAEEALIQVFGRVVKSPYMDKAPNVTAETQRRFPALAHVDGTARHQSVSRDDEPWLHALLTAVGNLVGLAALINTSFNVKGKPIVNRVKHCLDMLDSMPDLDLVLIEDFLFAKNKEDAEVLHWVLARKRCAARGNCPSGAEDKGRTQSVER